MESYHRKEREQPTKIQLGYDAIKDMNLISKDPAVKKSDEYPHMTSQRFKVELLFPETKLTPNTKE